MTVCSRNGADACRADKTIAPMTPPTNSNTSRSTPSAAGALRASRTRLV